MKSAHRNILFKACGALLGAAALMAPSTAHATDTDGDTITDEVDALPCDPHAQSVAYAPAKGQQGLVLFEDLWPSKGDIDFNDVVMAYNYIFMLDGAGNVSSMQVSLNLMAAGSAYNNGVSLHLPVPAGAAGKIVLNGTDGIMHALLPNAGETDLVIPIIADTLGAFGGSPYPNTQTTNPSSSAIPVSLYIKFATPVALDLGTAPFDLFIQRTDDASHQIHRPQYAGTDTMNASLFGTADDGSTSTRHFVDKDGLPFALVLPSTVQWPKETIGIHNVYPDIVGFAASAGATNIDWYLTNINTNLTWTGGANSTPAPVASLLGPTDPTEDVGCSPWKGTVQFGLQPYTWTYDSATDPSGNIIATGYTYGSTNTAAFATKYTNAGVQAWVKTFPTQSGYSAALGDATDATGNVFVAGYAYGSLVGEAASGQVSAFVLKLDPNGNALWARQIGGSYYSYAYDVAVGPDGSAYLAGFGGGDYGHNPTHAQRSFVAKIDGTGNVVWIHDHAADAVTTNQEPLGIALDPSGNIALNEGAYDSGDYSWHTVVTKLDATGNLLWSQSLPHGPASTAGVDYSFGWRSGADSQGNIYADSFVEHGASCQSYNNYYGSTYWSCTWSYQGKLLRFDPSGNSRGDVGYGSVNNYAQMFGLRIDAQDNVLLAGVTNGSLDGQTSVGNEDYVVAKVDPNGNKLWTRQGGVAQNATYGWGVAVDGSGSVFVAGTTNGDLTGNGGNPSQQYQSFITKYDASGTKQ